MYSELQADITELLSDNSDLEDIAVFAATPTNTPKEAEEQLNTKGVILIVGLPRQTRENTYAVNVSVPILIAENPEINTSSTGANVTTDSVLNVLLTNLDGQQTEEFWTPFLVRPFQQSDAEYGQGAIGVMLETKTIIVN